MPLKYAFLLLLATTMLLGIACAPTSDSNRRTPSNTPDTGSDSSQEVETDNGWDSGTFEEEEDTYTSTYDGDCGEECGEANHTGQALAIPDGIGIPYETTITLEGFGDGAVLENHTSLVSICVEMEHSWIRDLQIELQAPSGEIAVLNQFLGQEGGEVYLGNPNDNDSRQPNPGQGFVYCWKPDAINPPMLDYCNANFGGFGSNVLPAGDYKASSGFEPLTNCDLNGIWTLRCVDDWAIDNGYIFSWSINFDPCIIPDCDDWGPV